MRRFLLRRVAFSLLMLLVTTAFVFGLSRAAGDPRYLYLNEYSTAAQWEQWGEAMGLNRPLVVQYADWLWDALRLDFGKFDTATPQRPGIGLGTRSGDVAPRWCGLSVCITCILAVRRSLGG